MTVVFYALTDRDLCRNRLPVAHHLRDAGYRVVFVGSGSSCAGNLNEAGYEFHRISSAGRNALSDVSSILGLARLLRRIKPDILHTFGLRAALRGGLAARLARIPWVVHTVKAPPSIKNRPPRLLRAAFRDAEVTFPTKRDRDAFIAREYVRPEQTHVLRSVGIDLRKIPMSKEPDRIPVAAFISTPSGIGLQDFATAAGAINDERRMARFAVIGAAPSPQAEVLLHEWQEVGVLEWWGARKDLSRTLGRVHALCLPDDVGELSLIEAAAVGRPVVVIGETFNSQILLPGESGFVVPTDDAPALTSALKEILSNPDTRKQMGRRSRAIVESHYSAECVAREVMVVYERLFEKGRFV